MSEVETRAPPVVAESDEKLCDADLVAKMENVKVGETAESAQRSLEAEDDAYSDNARENGEERFHTPEVPNEIQNDDEAKLDDDEIEDNPAYIPRKGRYYMHDSRDAEGEVEEKKTSRADGTWKHDRYNERFQRPKTKKQIMTRYGFDIREGDGQDVEANQKQRSEESKKESGHTEEPTRFKRRPRRDLRQKRSRYERSYEATPKPRTQNIDKPERQAEHRPSAEQNKREDQAANEGRDVEDDDDLRVGQRRQVRAEHRRERHDRVDVRVVRNVRGSRGGLGGHRMDRHQHQTKERFDRDRYRDRNGDRAHYQKEQHLGEQRNYENHRRGAMRGTVRGALDSGNYYDARGGYAPRGNYSSRPRGGISQSPRAVFDVVYPSRGFTGPKRYSEQRGEILPSQAQMTVPPPIPPPQHNFSIPRQPTDVVYFDPTQQV
uniref:Protein CASC3 n=1 Tax=Angiostrongylus cantonensis TaxID=6313 RepID=A0A158P796_ANGCA